MRVVYLGIYLCLAWLAYDNLWRATSYEINGDPNGTIEVSKPQPLQPPTGGITYIFE